MCCNHVHVLITNYQGRFGGMPQGVQNLLKVEEVGLGCTAVLITGHEVIWQVSDASPLQAVLDGLGVALTSTALAGKDLENGRLVQPFSDDLSIKSAFKPYLVYPEGALLIPRVRAFRDWAMHEAGRLDIPDT